jgi:hypothetical protein
MPAWHFCAIFWRVGRRAPGHHASSGKGGKTSTKRTVLFAAGSLLTAFLSNADPGNRALAQEPARKQTLSEIYRDSGDIELQNKVAPFKVFDNLYHVGPGCVDAWLIPTSPGIIMIDTAEEPFVDHVIDNIMVIKEGDTLTIGATMLKFHHHPGHTPGVLSAEFMVYDNGTPHKAFWQGGGGSRGGLAGAQQAIDTAKRFGELQGVEVFVMIHSWLPYPNGGVFERAQLLARRVASGQMCVPRRALPRRDIISAYPLGTEYVCKRCGLRPSRSSCYSWRRELYPFVTLRIAAVSHLATVDPDHAVRPERYGERRTPR